MAPPKRPVTLSEVKEAKKALTPQTDLLTVFQGQIKFKAWELQYGDLHVIYKVRGGEIKEATVTHKTEKLRPYT